MSVRIAEGRDQDGNGVNDLLVQIDRGGAAAQKYWDLDRDILGSGSRSEGCPSSGAHAACNVFDANDLDPTVQ